MNYYWDEKEDCRQEVLVVGKLTQINDPYRENMLNKKSNLFANGNSFSCIRLV